MTNCENFCTAEKCAELETRIEELERIIEEHISEKIPYAHQWDGSFNLSWYVYNQTLTLELDIDNIGTASQSIELPFITETEFNSHVLANINSNNRLAHTYIPEIDNNLTAYNTDEGVRLVSEIWLEGKLGFAQTDIAINQYESNLKIEGTVTNQTLLLSIADGNSQDTTEINLPFTLQDDFDNHLKDDIPLAHEYNPSIDLNADIQDNILSIDVAIDDNFDTATVELSSSNLTIDGIYQDEYLTLTISNGNSEDTAQILIALPDMNCDELENLINNRSDELKDVIEKENDQNQAIIDSITFQLDLRTGEIGNLINEVLQELNSSFSDTFVSGSCSEELTSEGELKELGIAIYQQTNNQISSSGISGLREIMKLINAQIAAIHRDLCSAIPPNFNLKNVTPLTCLSEGEANISTEQFLEEGNDFNYLLAQFQGDEDNFPEPNTVSLRKNIYQYLAYRLHILHEQQINLFQLTCGIDTTGDVVSIVANDKVITHVSSTQLILHFVTLNNYPKRAKNSSYRPVQIPGAKKPTENNSKPYDWLIDFDELYWIQGNQYAELRFVELYAPVSGWFENEAAANSFFDKVLNLTLATENNRVIPLHSNPKTNVPVRTTRPYRAFICELNEQGQNQCLAKYQPVT